MPCARSDSRAELTALGERLAALANDGAALTAAAAAAAAKGTEFDD